MNLLLQQLQPEYSPAKENFLQQELYSFLFQEYFHTERLSVCNRKLLLLMVLYPVIFWISSKLFVPFPVILKSICHKLKMRHLRADFGVNFL